MWKDRIYKIGKALRYNVVAMWSQCGRKPALGNLRQEKWAAKALRSVRCLSEASLHALAFGGHFLANFLKPGYFLFASFLFCTSKLFASRAQSRACSSYAEAKESPRREMKRT